MSDPQDNSTRTDLTVPAREISRIPMISAEAYSHLGRHGGALTLACFEMIGGLPRMASWADQNPTDFFTKLFPKVIARSQQVDVTGTLTIDDAISKLEGERGPAIDAEFNEISRSYDL